MNDVALRGLGQRGHIITREEPDATFEFGGAQLIRKLEDGYVAGSDHRKAALQSDSSSAPANG